jgi:flagella basal body P-ring formation protein FlgA
MRGNLLSWFRTVLCCAVGLVCSHGAAELRPGNSIEVAGRSQVVVTESQIRLADVATVSSPLVQDDEAVIALKKVVLAPSPRSGERVVLEGRTVLDLLAREGFDPKALRYNLPLSINVTRAAREIGRQEVEDVVRAYLAAHDDAVTLKQIIAQHLPALPADSNGVEVIAAQPLPAGLYSFDLRARSEREALTFSVRAAVDEWRSVPVAKRPIKRGAVVQGEDVEFRRVKRQGGVRDVVENISDLIGRQATRDIAEAEVFSAASVVVPPLVVRGSKVTLRYRRGRLEATATGVALESGAARAEIKVRNDGSQRIVTAAVVEEGLVQVGGRDESDQQR